MIMSKKTPVRTGLPRIVVFQPTPLFAEAVAAVIHKYTDWRVECATADLGAAIAAASGRGIAALLFESPGGSAKATGSLIRRLCISCPRVPLILLTQREGGSSLRSKAVRGLAAIAHFHDSVDAVRDALEAVENGFSYRSPVIRQRLGLAPLSGGKVRRTGSPGHHRNGPIAGHAGAT